MADRYGSYYKTLGIIIDMVLLNLAGLAGYLLMLNLSLENLHLGWLHVLLINFLWFNVTQATRLYRDFFARDAIPTLKAALGSLFIFALLIFVLIALIADFHWYSIPVLVSLLLFSFLLLSGKIIFLLWRRSSRASRIDYKPVLILGTGPLAAELKTYLDTHPLLGYKVMGFFDDGADAAVLGPLQGWLAYAKENGIKEVFCVLPDEDLEEIYLLRRQADQAMVRFKMVPDVKDYFRRNVKVQWFGHMPVLSTRTEPLEIRMNQILKRGFDIVISLFVIIFLLSWLFPLLAIWIKLSSKGPVLFRQLRSGKNNESFRCLKFRSMVVNDQADSLQAVKNDHRLTKIGAFMRRNSIDELPQFINVLLGDMSVVGPRPHMLQHTAAYAALIEKFMVRHLVLPGITGWAQTKGLRGETSDQQSMQERVEADIWYLENWSLFLDMKIVFLTAVHVLVGNDKAH